MEVRDFIRKELKIDNDVEIRIEMILPRVLVERIQSFVKFCATGTSNYKNELKNKLWTDADFDEASSRYYLIYKDVATPVLLSTIDDILKAIRENIYYIYQVDVEDNLA